MENTVVFLLNGLSYGLLLFMLSSGLTLIFSMMGVLNFAHTSFYMLGAYFAFSLAKVVGFWPALFLAPILVGVLGAFFEKLCLRRVHKFGHVPELLITFGLSYVILEVVQLIWGRSAVDYQIPEALRGPLFTLVNGDLRVSLERRAGALNLPLVPALDAVTDALSRMLGQEAKARPGRQHQLDAAYFARVEAIQFTVAHDDGIGWENWEQADIVLAGVSRTSKTPTSIYLANRGFKTANIPIVIESPPPEALFGLRHPLVVGLTTAPERLIQVRRNRLLSLNQAPDTAYVDQERVAREVPDSFRFTGESDVFGVKSRGNSYTRRGGGESRRATACARTDH